MNKFTRTAQWVSGMNVEDFLDNYYRAQGWRITRTTSYEERTLCLGDRHYRHGSQHLRVEYKSGIQTFYTGNVFLETVSVDTQNKPGWVYTCKADYILYAALLNRKILVFVPDRLRAQIEALKEKFSVVKTGKNQNKGYDTHGVIIPLSYAESHVAAKVIRLEGDLV